MGKNGKKRKRAARAAAAAAATSAQASNVQEVDPDALDTTIETLTLLAANPELFRSSALRELRAALHPLVQLQLQRYDGVDYCAAVTNAMQFGKWSKAHSALSGARDFNQVPKQGTVQRWVRACDSAPAQTRLRLLDAILRAAPGAATAAAEVPTESLNLHDPSRQYREELSSRRRITAAGGGEAEGDASLVRRLPPWLPTKRVRAEAAAPDAAAAAAPAATVSSRVVLLEKGPDRQPPNVHDLRIWATAPRTVRMGPATMLAGEAPATMREDVPAVPGAFVVSGVLSRRECSEIVATAETLGFVPDHPVGKESSSGIDACEWLIDDSILANLFERVKSELPQTLPRGATLAAINARWRLFRYSEGAVYRPHIDGSWPASGLSAATGEYVHDGGLPQRRSRLTLLLYLNEGFEGGATTFFLPSAAAGGGLEARGVVPQIGTCLCFPQGNTASLVHEGSPVTSGVKYVARTDVLYDFS